MKKSSAIRIITDKIFELLESGKLNPWTRHWKCGLARNLKTGHVYHGCNSYLNYIGLYFFTFKQAAELHQSFREWKKVGNRTYPVDKSGNVIKFCQGTTAYPVIYAESKYVIDKDKCEDKEKDIKELKRELKAITGKEINNSFSVNSEQNTVILENDLRQYLRNIFVYNIYYVFNIEDLDTAGNYHRLIKEEDKSKLKIDLEQSEIQIVKNCIEIVKNLPSPRPIILPGNINKCYYLPEKDTIRIPFAKHAGHILMYYKSLFHEIAHSTGHKKRLNRKSLQVSGLFDNKSESLEELIAEFTASMLAGYCSIPEKYFVENSAAYVKSWISYIADKKEMLYEAIKEAEKAFNYIINKEVAKE